MSAHSRTKSAGASASSWRDVLPIHPAAELFPRMSPDELRALGEDIKKNGLTSRIAVVATKRPMGWHCQMLDGINRLDAMQAVGLDFRLVCSNAKYPQCSLEIDDLDRPLYPAEMIDASERDPYAYVVSANIHRRHLTAEQKRDLIAKLIKATPEKSDRQIAETVKASHHTVGAVRTELEATGQVAQLPKTVGKDRKARKRPAKRAEQKAADRPPPPSADELQQHAERIRALMGIPKPESPNSADEISHTGTHNENARLRGEAIALRSEIREKDAEIEGLRNAKQRLENDNAHLRGEIERLRTENAALYESLDEASKKFVRLSGDFDDLRHRMSGVPPPPDDDGLGIPQFLRRSAS